MDLVYEQTDSTAAITLSDYLKKRARAEKDSAAVSWGHYGNYLFRKYPENVPYLDSLIYSTKGLNTVEEIFGLATNADHYYYWNDFSKALTYYLKTRQLSLALDNDYYIKYSTGALADIKFLSAEYSESLALYHSYKNMESDNELELIFNIANCHYELNNIDSLSYYSRLGINRAIKEKDTLNYESFLRLNGVSHYKKGNLKRALDSLQKSRRIYLDSTNLASSYYYTALTFEAMGNRDSLISYFRKIDSLNQEPKVYFPEIKNVYVRLYENAKKNNEEEEQLSFIEKYMYADSVLQSRTKGLISRIDRDYDLPLIQERRTELRVAKSTRKTLTYTIILLVVALVSVVAYFLQRSLVQKKRLKEAIGNPQNFLKAIPAPKLIIDSKKTTLTPELIVQLDDFFEEFSKNKGFLDSSISLQQLASEANTNPSYLSKYLNEHKGGYTDYINSLRVQYAFSDMASNPKILIFTLDHIAKQYGFTSLRAFNRAFDKFLKIKPRDYLSQIKDQTSPDK